jgi:hypothetical protein
VYVPAGGSSLAIDISDLVAPLDGDAGQPAPQVQKPVQ